MTTLVEFIIRMIDGGDDDARIPIFVAEIESRAPGASDSCWWTESFGSIEALNAFIAGFRCAATLFGQPEIAIKLPAGGISAHVLGWSRPRVLWPD